jgi:hypothetical protein
MFFGMSTSHTTLLLPHTVRVAGCFGALELAAAVQALMYHKYGCAPCASVVDYMVWVWPEHELRCVVYTCCTTAGLHVVHAKGHAKGGRRLACFRHPCVSTHVKTHSSMHDLHVQHSQIADMPRETEELHVAQNPCVSPMTHSTTLLFLS